MLAQALLEKPKMCNHARGLRAYTGERREAPLTIQSTGMDGPSAAVVMRPPGELGVRRAVRIGTWAAVSAEALAGEPVLAVRAAGRTRAGAGREEPPDERLYRE